MPPFSREIRRERQMSLKETFRRRFSCRRQPAEACQIQHSQGHTVTIGDDIAVGMLIDHVKHRIGGLEMLYRPHGPEIDVPLPGSVTHLLR